MREVIVQFLTATGSTRSAALMRIGLPLLIWTRMGDHWLLYRHHDAQSLLVVASYYLSTFAMLLGWHSRLSTAWVGLTMLFIYYGVGQVGGVESFTHHHIYILAVAPCLLAFTECGRSWSWDRWRAVKRGAVLPEHGPTWGLSLITLQLSQIYLWGAVSKFTGGYLSGERLEQIFMRLYSGSDYPDVLGFHELMVAGAVLSVVLELILAGGLFIRRLHWWLLPVGVLFHALMYVTLPVATFSATMWLLYLAVLDPDRVHEFIDEISGWSSPSAGGKSL
ncbi:MAG: HTTM domain-containing protein [Myxococcota bacterium]|nr:HTTM domain-containing protein [Myxococcota bacterium]